MKQLLLLSIILTQTCLQSHAQNITGTHTLRIDDKVEKQLVEYELNDESAMNVVWDLRDLSTLTRNIRSFIPMYLIRSNWWLVWRATHLPTTDR
ncbi:MAG: hypothetical protein J6I37_08350 [Prevotella sp.]|nr:hypothetical protein [Prevotella sp.]